MKYTKHFMEYDPEIVKRMVRENPWATLISSTSNGMVASHYPVLLEEHVEEISLVTHLGRPDDELHEVGQHEMLVIIQGPHGYISPSWYTPDQFIPTWNHVTAHLYGTPQILESEENFAVLTRLTDHFERGLPEARSLSQDEDVARRTAQGTVGLRIPITRFEARRKLSQNKSPEVIDRIRHELEHGKHYRNRRLAREHRLFYDQTDAD